MSSSRQLVVPAQHDQLARLATFVAVAAAEVGFAKTQINRIELAVDEACSNIIDHAYKGGIGPITLVVDCEPGRELKVILIDRGKAFDPGQVPDFQPCGSLDHVKIGGLGIHLMRQAMDDVCFEFDVPGLGNRLTMTKRL